MCRFPQRPDLCQKSRRNDTGDKKKEKEILIKSQFDIRTVVLSKQATSRRFLHNTSLWFTENITNTVRYDRCCMQVWGCAVGSILVWATLVCALMKGNPTLHLRKSKSTSSQEIPFSSCKTKDRRRVRGGEKDRLTGDRVGDTHGDRRHREEGAVYQTQLVKNNNQFR